MGMRSENSKAACSPFNLLFPYFETGSAGSDSVSGRSRGAGPAAGQPPADQGQGGGHRQQAAGGAQGFSSLNKALFAIFKIIFFEYWQ